MHIARTTPWQDVRPSVRLSHAGILSSPNSITTHLSALSFWMTLSDLAKYTVTRSVAQSLCDSWASCPVMLLSHKKSTKSLQSNKVSKRRRNMVIANNPAGCRGAVAMRKFKIHNTLIIHWNCELRLGPKQRANTTTDVVLFSKFNKA